MDALNRAADLFGGKSKLARAIGVKPQVVCNWFLRERVPFVQAAKIEHATKGAVTLRELCPNLYPPEAA